VRPRTPHPSAEGRQDQLRVRYRLGTGLGVERVPRRIFLLGERYAVSRIPYDVWRITLPV
jgi:hypothetical protein